MNTTEQRRLLGQLEMDLSDVRLLIKSTNDEQRLEELRDAYRNLELRIESVNQLIEDLEGV